MRVHPPELRPCLVHDPGDQAEDLPAMQEPVVGSTADAEEWGCRPGGTAAGAAQAREAAQGC